MAWEVKVFVNVTPSQKFCRIEINGPNKSLLVLFQSGSVVLRYVIKDVEKLIIKENKIQTINFNCRFTCWKPCALGKVTYGFFFFYHFQKIKGITFIEKFIIVLLRFTTLILKKKNIYLSSKIIFPFF